MKKIISYVLCTLSAILFLPAYSQEPIFSLDKYSNAYLKIQTSPCSLKMFTSGKVENLQGCCSWHKGVCGCQAGRAVCCDGVFSPTCTC